MKKKYDIATDQIRDWLKKDGKDVPEEQDVLASEDALIGFASAHSVPPPPATRDKVLDKISKLNARKRQRQALDPGRLPMLEETANWLDWQEATQGISPPEFFENIYLHPLESSEKRELFVIWVKEFVETEVHHDLLESFLILEGACECHITDEKGNTRIVRMGQGDFITMQLGETHDIRITSPEPAKAILQWKKLVA